MNPRYSGKFDNLPPYLLGDSTLVRYTVAFLCVVLTFLIRLALDPVLGDNLGLLTLYGGVAVAVWLAGWRPALVVALVGFLLASYFFVPPRHQLFQGKLWLSAGLIGYALSCGLIIYFGEAMRTARQHAEQQMDILSTTLASIGDAVIVTDIQGRVTSLNNEAERLTGWTNAEASGRSLSNIFRIVNEYSREPADDPVERVLRSGSVSGLSNHTVLITKDGRQISIDDSAAPIKRQTGSSLGVVLVFRDVSEQRKAEFERARLAAIVEFSGDAIFTKDLNGVVTSWNQSAQKLFGYEAEEIVGKPVTVLFPPERLHEEDFILGRLRQGQPAERLETVRMAKGGRRIPVSLSVSPLRDSDGRVIGASKIVHDVSELVAAREELIREKEWLSTTLASIGDAVILTDNKGLVKFINEEGERLTGWKNEEASGRQLDQIFRIINEESRQPVESPVDQVMRLGRTVGLANHTILVSRDGREIPIDDSAAPIRAGIGQMFGIVLVFRDFTERKRAEEALRESERSLTANLADMTTLYEVAAQCATEGAEFSQCLNAILQAAIKIMGADKGSLQLMDPISGALRIAAHDGFDESFLNYYEQSQIDNAIAMGVASSLAKPLIVENLIQSKGFDQQPSQQMLSDAGIGTVESTPLINSKGQILGVISTHFSDPRRPTGRELRLMDLLARQTADYLERQTAEAALREREERFHTMADSAPVMIWLSGTTKQCTWFNRQWLEFTGRSMEEELGNGWSEGIHPEDLERCLKTYAEAFDARQPFEMEFRLRRHDGNWRWILNHGVPIYESGHDFSGYVGSCVDVTELKQITDALRKTEAELQAIIDRTPFMLTHCTRDLHYRFVSSTFAQMLQRPASEINGKPIIEIVGNEGFATMLPHIQRVLDGQVVEYETDVHFHGVGFRSLHVIYNPEIDQQGNVIGWIASIRDLTESKRTQSSLSESLRRERVLYQFVDRLHRAESEDQIYAAALESILDGLRCDRASILLFNDAGVMSFVAAHGLSTRYMKAVEGHSPWKAEDVNAQPISISDVDSADLDENLREAIKNEGIRALHFIPLVTGRNLIGKFMVYYDEVRACTSEEIELSINIARQLSFALSRKRIDDALRENEERLRLATETGKVGIWDWDITSNRVLWTDSLYEVHGVSKGSFNGTVEGFSSLVHWDDKELVSESINRSLNFDEPYEMEFRIVKPNGEVGWVFTNAVVFRDGGKPSRMLGATLDITDRKLAEAEREALLLIEYELRQKAEESNRLKDEFLAIMSHELRNPLNVILGYSELLARTREIADRPELQRMMDAIKRNAVTQGKLIRDLLDLSRLRSGKLELNREVVSILAAINNAVDTVRQEADKKNIAISISASDEGLLVNGDPVRLEQIIWNLLNNAIKFTPKGGAVAVELGRNDSQAVLSVKDNGQGIDSSFLPHVFEIFRQADAGTTRAQSGMGVGLAVVRQLVELHGGNVSVFSDGPGRGAQFTVRIPLSRQTDSKNHDIADQIGSSLGDLKVLVLDDSEDTCEMLRTLLAICGADVIATTNGAEALQIAGESEFDVILSDISMPGMDGFEFLRKLRQIGGRESVPVLALTGFGRPEDVKRAQAEGFFAHLTKPLDTRNLLELLQQAVGSRQ